MTLLLLLFITLLAHFIDQGVADTTAIQWIGEPVKIAPSGGYARVRRVGESRWMAAYEDGRGSVAVSFSSDGLEWSCGRVVIPEYRLDSVYVSAANAEICILSDGSLLCAANYRPSRDGVVPYSIALSRSLDEGATWSASAAATATACR